MKPLDSAMPVPDPQPQPLLAASGAQRQGLADEAWYLLFADNPAPMFVYRREDFRLQTWNRAFLALYGYSDEQAQRLTLLDLHTPVEHAAVRTRAINLHGTTSAGQWGFVRRDGVRFKAAVRSGDVRLADQPCRVVVLTEIEIVERVLARERQRQALLERLARGDALPRLLAQLVHDHEALFAGSLCSVLLVDASGERLQQAVAPSLPRAFCAALEGLPVAEDAASCGAACRTRQRVVVADLETHPNWVALRAAARAAGLRACWSEPIIGHGDRVLGAFAVYRRVPLEPGDEELGGMQYAVQLAATAIVHDRTMGALRSSEQRLRGILNAIPDIVFLKDAHGIYRACNAAFERFVGRSEAQIVGLRSQDITDDEAARRNEQADARALMLRAPVAEDRWLEFWDGSTRSYFELVKTPLFDAAGQPLGVLGVGRDITERHQHEQRIEHLNRAYQLLSGVNEAIVRLREPEALFQELCRIAVHTGGFRLAWVGVHDEAAACVRPLAVAGPQEDEDLARKLRRLQRVLRPQRQGPVLQALRSGQPCVVADVAREPMLAQRQRLLRSLELYAMAVLPIAVQGLPRHGLVVYADDTTRFDDEQLALLVRLAHNVGFALEFMVAAKAHAEAQQLRTQIVESVAGLFFAIDEDSRLVMWNRRIVEILGREPKETNRGSMLEYIDAQDHARVANALREGFERGHTQVEARVRAADGSSTPYLLVARRLQTADGSLLTGTGTDISERVRGEAELARYRAGLEVQVRQRTAELETINARLQRDDRRLRSMLALSQRASMLDEATLLQQALVEIVALDGSHSAAAYDVGGDAKPRPLATLGTQTPAQTQQVLQLAQAAARGGPGSVLLQSQFIGAAARDSGRAVLLLCLWARAEPYQASDLRELQLLANDLWRIVQRRRTEIALERAKVAADAANQAKSAFLANMSHEIRTPMNAVLGFAHLLRRDPLSERQLDHLEKITSASQHLLQVINDILDFSKIEADKLTLEDTGFELRASLQRVHALQAGAAQAKGLQLRLHIDPRCPARVRGDPLRLEQVLLNLLSNAVKFTPRGAVELRVQPAVPASRSGSAPVPAPASASARTPEEAMLLFEIADTGIGLDATQQAQIFDAFAQGDTSTTRRFGGTGLGLAISRRLVQKMQGRIGVRSRKGEGSCFWVLLPLPRMDEVSAAAALEADQAQTPAPTQAPTTTRAPHAASAAPSSSELRGKRVLVAEDNPVNQEVTGSLLHALGIEVELAASGDEALRRFPTQAFDLVLMDVQMPGLDGLQTTAAIRALPRGRAVPIIAMTANAFAEQRARCLAAGMNDYLAKPVEPLALEHCLRRWLLPAQASAPPLAAAPASAPAPAPAPASAPEAESMAWVGEAPRQRPASEPWRRYLTAQAGFDVDAALARLGGNEPLFVRTLAMFSAHHAGDGARLQALQDDGDARGLRALAHSLAGAAAAIGASAIEQQARTLQKALTTAASDAASTASPAAPTAPVGAVATQASAWPGVPGEPALAPRVQPLVQALARGLHALQSALQADADAASHAAAPAASAGSGAEPALARRTARRLLQQLQPLLSAHDTAALTLYERERGLLEQVWGPAAREFGRHLREFDFSAAQTCLQPLLAAIDSAAD